MTKEVVNNETILNSLNDAQQFLRTTYVVPPDNTSRDTDKIVYVMKNKHSRDNYAKKGLCELTICLPVDLKRDIKTSASRHGLTLSQLVLECYDFWRESQ